MANQFCTRSRKAEYIAERERVSGRKRDRQSKAKQKKSERDERRWPRQLGLSITQQESTLHTMSAIHIIISPFGWWRCTFCGFRPVRTYAHPIHPHKKHLQAGDREDSFLLFARSLHHRCDRCQGIIAHVFVYRQTILTVRVSLYTRMLSFWLRLKKISPFFLRVSWAFCSLCKLCVIKVLRR